MLDYITLLLVHLLIGIYEYFRIYVYKTVYFFNANLYLYVVQNEVASVMFSLGFFKLHKVGFLCNTRI